MAVWCAMRLLPILLCFALAGCTAATQNAGFDPASGAPQSRPAVVQTPRAAPRARPAQPLLLANLPAYRHPQAEAMLRETLGELLRAANMPGLPQDVTILDMAGFNAALQANRLYVTRGLLALMNDRSELAAALAHELGHAIARHPQRRAQARQQAVAETIDAARTFNDPGINLQVAAAQRASLAAFSREQEHEADAISIDLLTKAGYDSAAVMRMLEGMERMSGMFARLTRLGGNQPGASALASHPPTPERIALVRQKVLTSGGTGGRTDRAQYLAAIEGLRFGENGNAGFIRGRAFVHPGRDVAITLPQGFVPAPSQIGVLGVRQGGSAFALFAPARAVRDPHTSLRATIARIGAPAKFENIPGGAAAYSDTPQLKRRIAIVVRGSNAYTLMMYSKTGYAGFDNDFRAATAAIRQLGPRDRDIARPWRIATVTAQGPGSVAQFARQAGDPDFGAQTLLALNGLTSASQVRPGMALKVLAREAGTAVSEPVVQEGGQLQALVSAN